MSKLLYCALFIVLMALMACSGPEASSSPTAVAQAPTTALITAPTAALVEAPAPTEVPAPTTVPTTAPTEVPVMATSIPTPTPEPTPAPTATPRPTSIPVPTPETLTLTWRGVTVAPEERCSPSVEPRIVDELGGIYGPYTGTWFESIRETDIEHIVARSEAHDSGLCAGTRATRAEFAPTSSTSRWHLQASTGTRRSPTTLPSGSQTSTSAGTSTVWCRCDWNTASPSTAPRPTQ